MISIKDLKLPIVLFAVLTSAGCSRSLARFETLISDGEYKKAATLAAKDPESSRQLATALVVRAIETGATDGHVCDGSAVHANGQPPGGGRRGELHDVQLQPAVAIECALPCGEDQLPPPSGHDGDEVQVPRVAGVPVHLDGRSRRTAWWA